MALLVTLVANQGSAQIPSLTLTWDAPPGCPSGSDVERSVDGMLGSRVRDDRRIDARVVVTHRPSGLWTAELAITGSANGSRQLEGESCSAIALATSVVLARIQAGRSAPSLDVRIFHNGPAEVYVNGNLAYQGPFSVGYRLSLASETARASLVTGKNDIAVHCRQNTDQSYGPFVDLGLGRFVWR